MADQQSSLSSFDDAGGDDGPDEAAIAEAVAGDGGTRADVADVSDYRFPDAEGTVEFAVTQVDYTVEGRGDDEYPVVHVFGRTADGDAEHARVYGFRPYFYAPVASLSHEQPDGGPLTEADFDDDRLTEERLTGIETYGDRRANGEAVPDDRGDDEVVTYESIRGEELVKIFGQTPRDVGQLRDRFDHYEADILFPNRLLIDKDIRSGVRVPARRDDDGSLKIHHTGIETVDLTVEPRVCTFDIEVDDRQGFPEDGEETIVCLTSHDSYDDQYVVWLYESPEGVDGPAALEGYEPIGEAFEADVRVFDDESEMLDRFVTYVEGTDPDVLTGWNFSDFDAPYLLDRMEELGLDVDRLSRVDEVWRSDWQGPDVKGRVVFDLLYAYKRTQFTELESYRLDAVGETELGVGKERYSGDIGDLWEREPERLLEYNLRDVELCVELDRKQDIVAFWNDVRTFVGCLLEDAPTPGDVVDMYLLHEVHGRFALPSKGQQETEEFEGGAVFEPVTGVKEMVSVLDLKSLYPMCMVTINASPETKVDPATYDGDTYRAPNGQHFRTEPDGVMREMVDDLLSERDHLKASRDGHEPGTSEYERFDRQQQAVKVIMNCFTPDTEVLTPNGVQSITELDAGDEVYSLDPETMEMEVKPVVETHAYPEYRGELIDVETSQIDFRVTPNHRMLVRKNETNGITEDDYRFVEAGDLDRATNYELPHDWTGPVGDRLDTVDLTELVDDYEVWVRPEVHGHTFAAELGYYPETVLKNDIGEEGYVLSADEFEEHREYIESVCERSYIHREAGRKWIPRTYDADDFFDLLAWYVTEGSVYTSEEKQFGEKLRGSATTIQLAQEAPALADGGTNAHPTIGSLLNRMGFDYYADDRCFQFTSTLLGELLRNRCGGDSFEKRIPELVWGGSNEQKRRFLDTLVDGDGDRQPNSWRYTTSSEQLRDDVLRLCAHLGLNPKYSHDSGSWRIYVDETAKNTLRMHRSATKSAADDGVYCVTVEDNHTLLAGRNGRFQWVGQSLYGVSGWDRFRLYDKENAAAITATGRRVIEFTEEAVNEMGHEVTYGDTDSVMLSLGDMSVEEAIDTSFEIEEYVNGRYGEFAREELNAEIHRLEIEFEKLYRRFFQAGKKKRYAGHIVWKEGKEVDDIDITGFEYKRSDIAPITKEVQHEVIEKIVTGEPLSAVKEYVHEVIEEFQRGNVSLEEVGIPGGIGKRLDNYDTDTAHVRGAKYANLLLGTNFQRGSKPKRLYLKNVHADFFERMEAERGLHPNEDPLYGEFKAEAEAGEAVICFEYADQVPEEFEIDWEKMLDKTLKGPIARVLEALEISWEEVKTGQEQAGLSSFT